jgi:hypothetical protein
MGERMKRAVMPGAQGVTMRLFVRQRDAPGMWSRETTVINKLTMFVIVLLRPKSAKSFHFGTLLMGIASDGQGSCRETVIIFCTMAVRAMTPLDRQHCEMPLLMVRLGHATGCKPQQSE